MNLKTTEHQEQVKVVQWAKHHEHVCPQLKMLFAVPNGGHRHKAVGARLKAEGVKKGVPDLICPAVLLNCEYNDLNGVVIEMKVGKNSTTKEQAEWLQRFRDNFFYTAVCYSADEAIEVLKDCYGAKE